MMDEITVILITLSVNMGYALIHYLVRKITQIYALKYASKNQDNSNSNLKTFLSNSSDKDQINEIHI